MDYPSTDEVLSSMEQETAPKESVEKTVESRQEPVQVSKEPAYLDFDKYKTHHVTYKANGKEVKEPLEKVLGRASQGYNYAQLMEQMKQRQAQFDGWEKEKAELGKWKQYDEYAKNNPEWSKYVEDMWNKRGQYSQPGMDPQDPTAQQIAKLQQALEGSLSQYGQKISSLEEYINSQKNVQADKQLDESISQIRAKYKQLDLDQVDEQGKSNEYKILEHMQQTGIKNFETALRDLFFDDLVTSAKSQALQATANDKQKQAKQGIVGVSQSPQFSKPDASVSVRGKTWEQLAEMAKADMQRQAQ
jgi:hypothetical protein